MRPAILVKSCLFALHCNWTETVVHEINSVIHPYSTQVSIRHLTIISLLVILSLDVLVTGILAWN